MDALHNLALLATACELLGVMEKAQEITFDYLRVRKQFGKLIGSFQALQHQAVNIYIKTEAVRSLVYQIAANNDAYRIDPALAIAAKAKASEDALTVTQACIQLHGGIGFTDEHDIGLYLKRAMLLSSQFGNAAAQRRRYAALGRADQLRRGLRWRCPCARTLAIALSLVALTFISMLTSAQAAELKVLSGNGARAAVRELCEQFERASGHKVTVHFEVNAALEKKIAAGEAFDVAVLNPQPLDALD